MCLAVALPYWVCKCWGDLLKGPHFVRWVNRNGYLEGILRLARKVAVWYPRSDEYWEMGSTPCNCWAHRLFGSLALIFVCPLVPCEHDLEQADLLGNPDSGHR